MSLTTPDYQEQLRQMHEPDEDGRTWGATAARRVYDIKEWMDLTDFDRMLDYGSADGKFAKQFNRRFPDEAAEIEIIEYDPGIIGKESNNIPCPFVLCCDVLEHVEPDLIDNVLNDLVRCTENKGLFYIAMYPAKKELPDGRNAHLIIENQDWWYAKIRTRFRLLASRVDMGNQRPTLMVYVEKKDE